MKNDMKDKIKTYEKYIENAIPCDGIDETKTFRAWHRRVREMREVVLAKREELEERIAKNAEIFSEEYAGKQNEALRRQYRDFRDSAERLARKDLGDILAEKRAQWRKTNEPPTEEMIRLLAVLQMRGASIFGSELALAARVCAGNGWALRSLESIAKKAGYSLPSVADPDEFEDMMRKAEEFSRKYLADIDRFSSEIEIYEERVFWDSDSLDRAFYDPLDSDSLTAPTVERVPAAGTTGETAPVTASDPGTQGGRYSTRVRVDRRGINLRQAAAQFGVSEGAVRKENPGLDFGNLREGDFFDVPSTQLTLLPDGAGIRSSQCRAMELGARPEPRETVDLLTGEKSVKP